MPPRRTTGPPRPTRRELSNKVRDALTAIGAGCRELPLTKHLTLELPGLERLSPAQLWALLPELLKEIQTCDPIACYAGGHPPLRSYEPEIKDEELWAYRWPSTKVGCDLYLKFCIIKDLHDQPVYWHVDLHVDEPEKGKKR